MSLYEGLKPDVKWVPSTLRGFRQWQLSIHRDASKRPQSVSLRAMSLGIPWDNGRLTAKCFVSEIRRRVLGIPNHDDAPFHGCDCGIYSLSFPSEYNFPSTIGQFPSAPYFVDCTVNGVIKCGGKTYFGTLGFKTRHALIEAIHLPPPTTEYEFQVREVFKATFPSIAVFSNIISMYEQYPMDDFSSLFSPDKLERMWEARLKHSRTRVTYHNGTIVPRNEQIRQANIPANYPGKVYDI